MREDSIERKTRVVHVSTAHYGLGLDPRIFGRECVSLASAGYHVTMLTPDGPNDTVEGVDCVRIRRETRRWVRPFSGFRVSWKVLRLHPYIVHVHDPELIPLAVALRLLGLKTIYDAHEDLPKQELQKPWARRPLIGAAERVYVSLLEKSLRWLSAVVYVVDDQTESKMNSRAVLVRNFVREDLFGPVVSPRLSAVSPVTIVYVGGLGRLRGIRELIDGVGLLQEGQARLLLAGPWESHEFQDGCEQSTGWTRVQWYGVIAPTDIPGMLHQADIGVFCPSRGPNIVRSIPIKVLEYVACGLPMVLTDIPFWHEMFGDIPLYVAEPSAACIAVALAELIDDSAGRGERARQGLALLRKNGWYWANESAKLLALYDDLCGATHAAS